MIQRRLDDYTHANWLIQVTSHPGGNVSILGVHPELGVFHSEPFEFPGVEHALDWLDSESKEMRRMIDLAKANIGIRMGEGE